MFDFCFSYVVCDCSVATSIFLLWILTCNLLQLEQVRDNKHTLSAVFCVLSQLFTLLIVTTKVLRLHRIILWVPMNHGHIIILYRNVKPQRCCSFVECYCYEHLRRLKAKWKMPSHKDTKTRIRKKVFFFFFCGLVLWWEDMWKVVTVGKSMCMKTVWKQRLTEKCWMW